MPVEMRLPLLRFSLCCTSLGLHATTPCPGCELTLKLRQRLKYQKPLIGRQDMFDTFNGLELLSLGSLAELASPHGIRPDLSANDTACGVMARCVVAPAPHRVVVSPDLSVCRCISSMVH